jgi:hypothetical protein
MMVSAMVISHDFTIIPLRATIATSHLPEDIGKRVQKMAHNMLSDVNEESLLAPEVVSQSFMSTFILSIALTTTTPMSSKSYICEEHERILTYSPSKSKKQKLNPLSIIYVSNLQVFYVCC